MSHRMFASVFKTLNLLFFCALCLLVLLVVGSLLPATIGYQIRIVETGSMVPTIPVGAGVFVRPAVSYRVGDIVTYKRPTDVQATTHRVYSEAITNGVLQYTMRGDANNASDPYPVTSADIVGKVLFSIPYLGFILDFIRRPIGLACVVGIPLLLLIVEQVQKNKHTLGINKTGDINV